ncbi:hypothetical protein NL108_016547 [Boleophthalmus pectinirostris]|uniref:transcription factor IIIA-like n=1 Tax=Boleophthalmus pectinirostris TaxID=150288 RepID=UPI00242D80B6|nr:transcription factor IIIA-like [Boleophthalmus pectinirostris]KAJ0051239.1 hypothetical protein NL108_016547 [Boleophthalmus pectinirostris]
MEAKTEKHKRFICSFQGCVAAYNKQWKLDAHLCKHTGVKPHTCDQQDCGKSFSSPYHLARHQLIHSGDKPFPCTEEGCSQAFTTNSNRLRHIDRFHRDTQEPRMYVCDFEDCGLTFKKNKQLKSHMCEQHEKLPPYQCTFQGCTMRFTFPSKLKRHEKVHRGYPCAEEGCAFVGKTWTEFTAHRRGQHRTRFSCEECSRTFKDQACLKQHQRVHSDTRLVLKCPRGDCERTFTTAFNLQSHIWSFHEELRPFTCTHPGCGRSFSMKQSLIRHGVMHDPERKKIRKTPPNKRSLASRLSGFKDPKISRKTTLNPVQNGPSTRSGLDSGPSLVPNPDLNPNPNPVQNPHSVQTSVETPVLSQNKEIILFSNNALKPSVQSPPAQDPSPGLVQDSVELVSLLQDTSLLCETHVAKSLSASVTV